MVRSEYNHLVNKYQHRFLSERFKDLEISRAEAPYLHRISRAKNIKMNDLISDLPFHKSHTTRAINKLVEDRLITKIINPEDKRGYLLSITDKGLEVAKKVAQILVEWDELISTVITEEERQQIINVTKKVYHLLLEYYGEEDLLNEVDV